MGALGRACMGGQWVCVCTHPLGQSRGSMGLCQAWCAMVTYKQSLHMLCTADCNIAVSKGCTQLAMTHDNTACEHGVPCFYASELVLVMLPHGSNIAVSRACTWLAMTHDNTA